MPEYKSDTVGVVRKIKLDWAGETQDRVRGNQFGEYRMAKVEKIMAKKSGSGRGIKGLETRDV